MDLPKYPRTYHLRGSKGVESHDAVAFQELQGKHLVVEEKVDGSCVAVGFDEGVSFIRHRGSVACGLEFDMLKAFVAANEEALYLALEDRYVMYGEWLFAKHTIFYDNLPHLFLEYDVYDRQTKHFLSTPARQKLLRGVSVCSVRILHSGTFTSQADLTKLVSRSNYITSHQIDSLREMVGARFEQVLKETDVSGLMEGLYIKIETEGEIVGRYKYIRKEFIEMILASGSHWANRQIVQNKC